MSDIQRIKRALNKKKFYIWKKREELIPKIGSYTEYLVIYSDKDKIKFGKLKTPYWHRYGVDVIATYLIKKERFWYQSEKVCIKMEQVVENLMMKLATDGIIHLPVLDIDELEIRH